MARERRKRPFFFKAQAEDSPGRELWLFSLLCPQTWVQEKQEGSACVLPLGEPKGVPRAKEDPKALSQRQQAKELMWLWSRKQHSQRWEGPP